MNFTLKGVTSPPFRRFPPNFSLLFYLLRSGRAGFSPSLSKSSFTNEEEVPFPPLQMLQPPHPHEQVTAVFPAFSAPKSPSPSSSTQPLVLTKLALLSAPSRRPPPRFPGREPSPQTGTRARAAAGTHQKYSLPRPQRADCTGLARAQLPTPSVG